MQPSPQTVTSTTSPRVPKHKHDRSMVELDEEAERYYAQAPAYDMAMQEEERYAMHDSRYDPDEVKACMAEFERSLPSATHVTPSHPVLFHHQFTEAFFDADKELRLTPNLSATQTVTAIQVARLLQEYHAAHQSIEKKDSAMLDQIIGLIDRISITAQESTVKVDNSEGVIDERYAKRAVYPVDLPHGNTLLCWRDLIFSLARVGRVDEAFRVFESLEYRFKIIPNMPIFLSMWQLCKEQKNSTKAMEYFSYFIKCRNRTIGSDKWFNTKTFNLVLSILALTEDVTSALKVWKSMRTEEVEPDPYSYSSMIHILIAQGRINLALSTFEELKTKLKPPVESYNQILRGLVYFPADPSKVRQGESRDNASDNFDSSYAIMLKYYDELKQHDKPNGLTYALVMRGCASHGDYDKVFSVADEIQQQGLPLSASHVLQMIIVCGSCGKPEQALNLFWSMEERFGARPNPSCFNALLIALGRCGRYDLLEPTMLRSHDKYGLVVWPKTAAHILNNTMLLEDTAFSQRYARLLQDKHPKLCQTAALQGQLRRVQAMVGSHDKNTLDHA